MSHGLHRQIALWTTVLALGCGLFPQSATACRIRQFPTEAGAGADAAVVVELTDVTPLEDNSWRAKAVAKRTAFGAPTPETFEFGGYSRGASCGPRPLSGDLWVVYLRGDGSSASIAAFYPLGTAEVLDRRIVESGAD